jgi:hypothetical protein
MSSTDISKPLRTLNPGTLDAWWGPYDNIASACTAIPNETKDVDGVMVNFRQGKVVGITTTDGIIDYHWKKVYTDLGLVKKEVAPTEFDTLKEYTDPLSAVMLLMRDAGLSITDPNGAMRLKFDLNGLLSVWNAFIKTLNVTDATITSLTSNTNTSSILNVLQSLTSPKLSIGNVVFKEISGYNLVITDEYGFIKYDIDKSSSGSSVVKTAYKPNITADIEYYCMNGQSLSRGESAARISNIIALPDALKFDGYGFYENPQNLNAFESLIEDGSFETPCYGFAKMFTDQLTASGFKPSDNNYKILMSVPGQGGVPFSSFLETTPNFDRMLSHVQAGYDNAKALGKTFKVSGMLWTQSESNKDNSRAAYKALMLTYYEQYNRRIKQITNQTEAIPMIHYQVSSADTYEVPLAFLEAFEENPDKFYLACPMYMWDYNAADKVHLSFGISYKRYGAYLSHVAKLVTKDKIAWKPLKPISYSPAGLNFVQVKFNVPSGSLVFDTTLVSDPGNYGFQIINGSSQVAITSVEILRGDTVKITTAAPILPGWKLTYALKNGTPGESGRLIGQRGCLRDQQGLQVIFDSEANPFPLHNYCVHFEHIF